MTDLHSVKVSGNAVRSIVLAVQGFSVLANEMLDCLKVPKAGPGEVRAIDPDAWYSLDDYLHAYRRVETLLGARGLEKIGTLVPTLAQLPTDIRDIVAGLASLDLVYRMAHRVDLDRPFDPNAPAEFEGLGRYEASLGAEARSLVMECENPYHCRFDRGLVLGMAQRFEPNATIEHLDRGCRLKGAKSCTYLVRW